MAKQMSDGEQAALAYKQQADPVGDRSPTPSKEAGEAVAPVTTIREPSAPVDVWPTGAGETNEKLQAP